MLIFTLISNIFIVFVQLFFVSALVLRPYTLKYLKAEGSRSSKGRWSGAARPWVIAVGCNNVLPHPVKTFLCIQGLAFGEN